MARINNIMNNRKIALHAHLFSFSSSTHFIKTNGKVATFKPI